MNDEIKVSVIVPVYNVERYLKQSIQSIINQTLKDIEIILINDGSTDNSLSIMKELENKDNRIKIFSQQNNGQSVARNVGLIQAKGEYIYFFDSDDILEEKTLEECYNHCRHQNLDFVFFNADVFSEDNITLQLSKYNRVGKFQDKSYIGTELLKEQLSQNLFSASVCLTFIKKAYLDKENLFFYPRIIHEDELFVFMLYLKAKRIGFIEKVYFHRRLRPNSTMTKTFTEKNVIGYLTVSQELFKYYKFSLSKLEKKLLLYRMSSLIDKVYSSVVIQLNHNTAYKTKAYILKKFFKHLTFKTKLKLILPISLLSFHYKK